MKIFLQVIGYRWAAFGAFWIVNNIINFMHAPGDAPEVTGAIIGTAIDIQIIFFIFPGLIIGSICSMLASNERRESKEE